MLLMSRHSLFDPAGDDAVQVQDALPDVQRCPITLQLLWSSISCVTKVRE